MKKNLLMILFLSLITVIFNILTILNFIIHNYKDTDFIFLLSVYIFLSAEIIFLCYSLYKNNVVHGEKSISKIVNILLFLNWIDLISVSVVLIEGIRTEKNPFTNIYVLIPWTIITSIIVSMKYFLIKKKC